MDRLKFNYSKPTWVNLIWPQYPTTLEYLLEFISNSINGWIQRARFFFSKDCRSYSAVVYQNRYKFRYVSSRRPGRSKEILKLSAEQ